MLEFMKDPAKLMYVFDILIVEFEDDELKMCTKETFTRPNETNFCEQI